MMKNIMLLPKRRKHFALQQTEVVLEGFSKSCPKASTNSFGSFSQLPLSFTRFLLRAHYHCFKTRTHGEFIMVNRVTRIHNAVRKTSTNTHASNDAVCAQHTTIESENLTDSVSCPNAPMPTYNKINK
jgi:hypothetical protein